MSILSDIWNHPANRGARLRAIRQSIFWQLKKRISGRSSDVDYHGLKIRCYPNSHSASRAIYFSGLPDYREMSFIRDYLREGDRFIDVGANIGLYTLLARSIIGLTGSVDAFEPNSAIARVLKESIELNKLANVTVHEVGVADNDGVAEFAKTDDDCTGHIVTNAASDQLGEIPIRRLDGTLEDLPYAMAKFDIEGYEPFAIRGASKLLQQNNPPVMLIELAGYSKRHGITSSEFIDELDGLGYFVAVYDPDTKKIIPTIRPWEIPVDNILAISRDRRSEIELRLGTQ